MTKENKIKQLLKMIPTKPGVYFFYNNKRQLIYVGKATSLKSRVRSYFSKQKTPRPIEEMIHEVSNIKWAATDSVLEAIILEANLIKEKQPKYNVIGKDNKSWNYIYFTKDDFPTLKTVRQHEIKDSKIKPLTNKHLWGPFPGLRKKETFKILRKLFYYSDCKPKNKACFYRQIDLCLGVCTGELTKAEYKKKTVNPLSLFLSGKKKKVLENLKKQMKQTSKDQNYEESARIRDQINNLKKIHDVTLINESFFAEHSTIAQELVNSSTAITRIEGYDISNLGSTGKVGSMVTFVYGDPKKSDYRKFKIITVKGQSDVDCLAEVLQRRLKHKEWTMPDLFLIDGGKPQVNKTIKILKENKIAIPIIGIAKGPDRKKNEFHLTNRELLPWLKQNKKLLIQVRDEAHRFAIKYQRQLRIIKKRD
jgi:excinuclease ABC subunit C